MQYGLPPVLVRMEKVEEGRDKRKRDEVLWAVDCKDEVPPGGC